MQHGFVRVASLGAQPEQDRDIEREYTQDST